LEPVLHIGALMVYGLPGALLAQLRRPNPLNWLNPFHWQRLILENGFAPILTRADESYSQIKASLLRDAYGTVLEVGAGAGHSLKYYDAAKVERLYVLEPSAALRRQLCAAVARAGLVAQTRVVAAGIDADARATLVRAGVAPASIDTIVLVQVLCSIADPRAHLEFLLSLLKPGGQILLFEHVASHHARTRTLQNLWTPFWRLHFGGCELNRDSANWIRQLGGWDRVDIQRPQAEVSIPTSYHIQPFPSDPPPHISLLPYTHRAI
jgi:SAM-dependent methyltransferase